MSFIVYKSQCELHQNFRAQKMHIGVFFRSIISNVIETFRSTFFDQKLNFAQNRENKDWVLTLNEMH